MYKCTEERARAEYAAKGSGARGTFARKHARAREGVQLNLMWTFAVTRVLAVSVRSASTWISSNELVLHDALYSFWS